uniref:Uncharacterized protein n=1 Tax=Romanomermis culicivorax TaxID=13658 RepID=A0A915K1P5_ROMCU
MDKRAEEKKRKDAMTLTPIIAMTTTVTTQPPVIRIQTSLGAAQQALAPPAPTTSQGLQMPPPGILKMSKTPTKRFCQKVADSHPNDSKEE